MVRGQFWKPLRKHQSCRSSVRRRGTHAASVQNGGVHHPTRKYFLFTKWSWYGAAAVNRCIHNSLFVILLSACQTTLRGYAIETSNRKNSWICFIFCNICVWHPSVFYIFSKICTFSGVYLYIFKTVSICMYCCANHFKMSVCWDSATRIGPKHLYWFAVDQ